MKEARLFEQLRNDWQDISREDTDSHSVMQASLSAPPEGYRSALQLARLILLGASIDHAGRLGGQAFTLSLSRIWEDAVTQMCRDLEPQTGWRVQSKSIRLWDDAMGPDDKYRSLIADTLLVRGSDRWVLDAKYKRGFGNEDRNDRFQMCAYAAGFQAERATLVYPTLCDQKTSRRVLLNTTYGNRPLLIESLACEIASGPERCKKTLLRRLFSSGE
jgi:5-methylcytosine-specific restriction endonuclease McrBC regulatory subunit McrC